MPKLLSEEDIREGLDELNGWELQGKKLYKAYEFEIFVEAFGFMSRVGLIAEKLGHHPELYNAYNQVEIHLTTEELGGVSELDMELAHRIDRLD